MTTHPVTGRPLTGLRGSAAVLLLAVLVGGCAHQPPPAAATPSPSDPTAGGPATAPATTKPTRGPVSTPDRSPAAVSIAPYPRGRAGVPAGGLPPAATRTSPDPDVVTEAALRVLFGSDTVLDTQPMDAERRALPWLGGPLAAAVRAARITAAPGAVWNSWAAHHAHLVVTVTRGWDDGAPPDTPTAAHRQWLITQTPIGPGSSTRHWTGVPVQTVVYTTTTRHDGRWAVTTLQEAP